MRSVWLIVACICNTLFRYKPFCFQFGEPVQNHTSYAVGQALSYIFLLLWGRPLVSNKYHIALYETTMLLACSNLMDELFFDPIQLGLNEILFFITVIVWIPISWKISKENLSSGSPSGGL